MDETERTEIMLYLRARGLTLDRIGKAFGLTRERVRQIIGNTGHIKPVVCTPPVVGAGAPECDPAPTGTIADGYQTMMVTETITDGWQTWSAVCAMCGRKSMSVVRPGKIQCSFCG